MFVQAPSIEELEKRLRGRGTDSEEKIAERLAKASLEIERATEFDNIIVNDDLERAKKEAAEVLQNFLRKWKM